MLKLNLVRAKIDENALVLVAVGGNESELFVTVAVGGHRNCKSGIWLNLHETSFLISFHETFIDLHVSFLVSMVKIFELYRLPYFVLFWNTNEFCWFVDNPKKSISWDYIPATGNKIWYTDAVCKIQPRGFFAQVFQKLSLNNLYKSRCKTNTGCRDKALPFVIYHHIHLCKSIH